MDSTIVQATKKGYIHLRRPFQRPDRASLHAAHPVLNTLHLLVHCSTMLDHVVYSLIGYMHKRQNRAIGKATNKRRMNDYLSPKKRACQTSTLPLRNSKSQEVA